MRLIQGTEAESNLEINVYSGRRQLYHHQRTHNIVLNLGRQMMAEMITASAFGVGTFTPHRSEVARYIGFGIGGARQTDPAANLAPLSVDYPGVNTQVDTDPALVGLERPVQTTAAPLWMNEIVAPGTFPTATSTKFIAGFATTDFNFGSYSAVPLSEIALYTSSADPAFPNGAGAYPGAGVYTMAYDTFAPFNITGLFSIEVQWEFRF